MQRAFDQIIHDVSIQKLNVVFALDRAGLVGADGPTHHGAFDLSYLRFIPGMVLMAPKDESELRDMLYTAVKYEGGPIALRYPRGAGLGVPMKENFDTIEIGKSEKLIDGDDVALLAVGLMVNYSTIAAEKLKEDGINCEVTNMRFIKPLDEAYIDDVVKRHSKIVTLEESSLLGGFGSAVLEYCTLKNYNVEILRIGLPDKFIDHGTQSQLHEKIGIDPDGITEKVKLFFSRKNVTSEVVM